MIKTGLYSWEIGGELNLVVWQSVLTTIQINQDFFHTYFLLQVCVTYKVYPTTPPNWNPPILNYNVHQGPNHQIK